MFTQINASSPWVQGQVALAARLGLGSVFVIGGYAKLERLLTPSKSDAIVAEYVGPLGYINQTFLDWLFEGHLGEYLSPWAFLTTLSTFELVSGLMLVAGLMVRPLALVWAFLLWSFVVSLPVVTTPGVIPDAETYMSPAAFVQIRDIALSGFFFALYNLGAGAASVDAARFGLPRSLERDWDTIGLLLRLSLGIVFVIGGIFAGYSKIATFGMPGILLAIVGVGLLAGVGTRAFAGAAAAILLWYMATKLPGAAGVVGFLNSVKREFALLAVAGVIAAAGGGRLFAADRWYAGLSGWFRLYFRRADTAF